MFVTHCGEGEGFMGNHGVSPLESVRKDLDEISPGALWLGGGLKGWGCAVIGCYQDAGVIRFGALIHCILKEGRLDRGSSCNS